MGPVFKTQWLVEEPYFVTSNNQGHDFVMQWKLPEIYIYTQGFLKERQVLYFAL